jgi:tetratricopeptide (TPR) repeat protein
MSHAILAVGLLLLSAEMERGDLDRAIADYDRATELDPKQALAYSNRGFVYMSKGKYDQALAEYNPAVELDPHFANAYRGRAELKRKMGKLAESLADAEQVRSRTIRAPASWRLSAGATRQPPNTTRRSLSSQICRAASWVCRGLA